MVDNSNWRRLTFGGIVLESATDSWDVLFGNLKVLIDEDKKYLLLKFKLNQIKKLLITSKIEDDELDDFSEAKIDALLKRKLDETPKNIDREKGDYFG